MEKESIQSLLSNNSKEISTLYISNRNAFLNFGKKYGLDYDDLSDIYQEAFIVIRKHALSGKLNSVKSSFKTYLFGIGKFMIFNLLKEKKKSTSYDPSIHIQSDNINPVRFEFDTEVLTIEQSLIRSYFKKLGKKCQELLTLFYSNGLTIEEIIEHTNYANNGVVRSQKSRCIKTLKEMIKS